MLFVHETIVPAPAAAVFSFHERADALQRLLPPWERSEVLRPPASLDVGTVVVLRQRVGPVWITIEAEHVEYDPPRGFVDEMRRGPFAYWRHQHLFFEHPRGCRMRDEIEYRPPLGILGRIVDPWLIRPRLRRMFEYRHRVVLECMGDGDIPDDAPVNTTST